MEDNKRLIIHIGTQKTGTSALQRFLYDNNNILKEFGYCYPDLAKEMCEAGILIRLEDDYRYKNGCVLGRIINRQNKFKVDTNRAEWKQLWNILKKYLKHSHVILSEESIWWWDTVDFLNEVKKEHDNIEVIVYLRRQDRFIEAEWNQRVKRQAYCTEDFLVDVEKRKNNPMFHYYNKLEQIEKICGFEHLKVRVYEKGQFSGEKKDITSDFLDAFGIYPDWSKCIDTKIENESLFGNYLEIKRNLNTVLRKDDFSSNVVEALFLEVVKKEKRTTVKHVEGYFPKEKRLELLKRFEEQNKEIAKKYLNRSDGILFYERIEDIPEYQVEYQTMYADIIKVFAGICLNQQNRMNQLEKQRFEMLRLTQRNRKTVLFGAGQMCRDVLMKKYVSPSFIVDNNISVCGKQIEGIPVVQAKIVNNWKELFVVIACRESYEIEIQLESYGLKKYEDYILAIETFG